MVGAICLLFGTPGRAGEDCEIGKLAASLEPGEWGELESQGYEQKTLMRGDDILAYAGKAAWDPSSQQVLFIGQVHLKGPPVFITYSAKHNTWRRMPTPAWAKDLKWFHAYENNAADSERGIFYHHASDSRQVHKYDIAKDAWSTLPELQAEVGHGTALAYFPDRQALVRVYRGEVWLFEEEKNAWARLAKDLKMGPYHHFAAYSPKFKLVLLGGGNDSGAIHRLDAAGKISAGKPAPITLGIGRSLNVVDPVSGELLVLSKERKFLAYSPGQDQWRELPLEDVPFTKYEGHSVSGVPLSNYGVVLYFSSQPQGMKTYLYKHAAE